MARCNGGMCRGKSGHCANLKNATLMLRLNIEIAADVWGLIWYCIAGISCSWGGGL